KADIGSTERNGGGLDHARLGRRWAGVRTAIVDDRDDARRVDRVELVADVRVAVVGAVAERDVEKLPRPGNVVDGQRRGPDIDRPALLDRFAGVEARDALEVAGRLEVHRVGAQPGAVVGDLH